MSATFVYDGRAATDRASYVVSAGNVMRRRSATGDVQTDSLVDPRSRMPGVPHVDRRGPTSPSDRSPRNSPRRRQRRPLGRRLCRMTFWSCRVAEAAAAGRASCHRTSTSRAGTPPPTSCRGTRDDSEQRRQLAGSTWRRHQHSPPPARTGQFLSSTWIDYNTAQWLNVTTRW